MKIIETDILLKKEDMSEAESQFIKRVQKLIWQITGTILVVMLFASVPFYFDTKSDLQRSNEKIEELKAQKADRTTYELTIKQINQQLKDIKDELRSLK